MFICLRPQNTKPSGTASPARKLEPPDHNERGTPL